MSTPGSALRELTIDHIEFYVPDAAGAARDLVEGYGFVAVGSNEVRDDHTSIAVRQGRAVCVLTEGTSDRHPAARFVQEHGAGVGNIATRTPDATAAFSAALARGARPVSAIRHAAGRVCATIGAFGDVTHTFVQRTDARRGGVLPGFAGPVPAGVPIAASSPGPALREVDHLAVCLEAGTLAQTVDFYTHVLGFDVTFQERIEVGSQAMFSKVVQSASRAVTFTLIEPDTSATAGQIDGFLREHGGPGVQHVAFRSDNIVSSITALVARDVEFLAAPLTYYDMLVKRLTVNRYNVEQLRARSILVDQDHDGQLFQIFARSTHPRHTFFFEVIERRGARTFGSGNIRALYEAVEAERAKSQAVR